MARNSPRRSLQNVRTQSTRRAIGTLSSPELYIMLTSLEMERSRRILERNRLLDRVETLNERLRSVEAEQEDIRRLINLKVDPIDQASIQQPHQTGLSGFTY